MAYREIAAVWPTGCGAGLGVEGCHGGEPAIDLAGHGKGCAREGADAQPRGFVEAVDRVGPGGGQRHAVTGHGVLERGEPVGVSAALAQQAGTLAERILVGCDVAGMFGVQRRHQPVEEAAALHPQHAGDVAAYENALRQRGRLLADGNRDAHWFTALEDTMARHGVALAAARADTVHRLDAAARLGIGPFPRAALAMAGEVDGWVATMAALDAEDRLRSELAASRLRDGEAGTTSCGPHRSDLAVRHLDLDLPAAEGSTGQQKAVLVSIALAHARLVALSRGRAPLLLLDEIAAHLDAERRIALFDEVVALGVQCWMTGTDAELFAPLGRRAQVLRVADGSIAAA